MIQPRTEIAEMTIGELLENSLSALQSQIQRKQIEIGGDWNEVANSFCTPGFAWGIQQILHAAIHRSPNASTVDIYGVQTAHGIEVEIADSCSDSIPESHQAFDSRFVDWDLLSLGLSPRLDKPQLSCVPCPQGGMAWTVTQRRIQHALKVA